MAKKILRKLYADYKVKGHPHMHREIGYIDFKISEIEEEDVVCIREFLAQDFRCKPEEITDIVFHF